MLTCDLRETVGNDSELLHTLKRLNQDLTSSSTNGSFSYLPSGDQRSPLLLGSTSNVCRVIIGATLHWNPGSTRGKLDFHGTQNVSSWSDIFLCGKLNHHMARCTHACRKTSRELTSQKTGSYHPGEGIAYYLEALWCLQEDRDWRVQSV